MPDASVLNPYSFPSCARTTVLHAPILVVWESVLSKMGQNRFFVRHGDADAVNRNLAHAGQQILKRLGVQRQDKRRSRFRAGKLRS